MEIYVLRHAIAADRDPNRWSDDSLRPLTDRGKRRMKRAARGMRRLGLKFDAVLSSPYTRARETAEIVAGRMGFEVIYTEQLTATGSFEGLVAELQNMQPPPRHVLLVGHEPDLSEFICRLVGGQPAHWVVMRKGGLCKITVDHLDIRQTRGRVEWLLTPSHLRALA